MKKIIISAVLGLFCTTISAQEDMKSFIDNLMSKMTIDEKIGQLNLMSSYDFISAQQANGKDATLELIRNNQLGAIYGLKNIDRMRQLQEMAMKGKNKIPLFFGLDVLHGLETTYPIPLAMASSWNPDLVRDYARHAAIESTSLGVNWLFSPMVDVARDARWGRVAEGFGEDPYLSGLFAKAYVEGYQGTDGDLSRTDNVMACVKHYALYGAAEAGRDYNQVFLSRQEAMNGYMRPYYEACKAGAGSFMTSFNEFEGIPATANKYLIDDILIKQWGFDGLVVSDANAIKEMIAHGIGDLQEVSARALKAGVDMDMNSLGYTGTLKKSLEEGKVTEDEINKACRRVLEAKWKLGLFKDPYKYFDKKKTRNVYSDEMKADSRKVANECSVLLKNDDNLLPLSPSMKIALVGPFADDASDMQGTWAMSSHGKESISIYKGVSEAVKDAGGTVTSSVGSWLMEDSLTESTLKNGILGFVIPNYKPIPVHERPLKEMIDEAVASTKDADVIVACLGEANSMNGEGCSRADISIPEPQEELLKALKATGKPVVLVLTTGRPLTLPWEEKNIPAILCTWSLGDQAGYAIADVLFGKVNPSGKLTMSFPRTVGQCPIYYNHKSTGRPYPDNAPYRRFVSCYIDVVNSPLYPFGYGLSYTTFKYGPVTLSSSEMSKDNGSTTASVNVTNTGSREGMTTVQLYIHAQTSTSTRPVKELRAFKKINLKAGETQQVSFKLTPEDLKYFNHELEYVCEPGKYDIMIGDNSRDVQTVVLNVM
jgi:beta-glucosidase